jgi:hypothetical protein
LRRGRAENSTKTTIYDGFYRQRAEAYKPWSEQIKVAVKKVQLRETKENQRELDALLKFNHPNIIKLYHYEDYEQFR